MEINCEHRSLNGEKPVCQIVADITDRPLSDCHVNDSACTHCLRCGIAPQAPNMVTASMAIGAAQRTGDTTFAADILSRMRPHLRQASQPETKCVLRGPQVREVECKPCQAGGGPRMVPVFRCPRHGECTVLNTGLLNPKIQGCATCDDRLPEAYKLEAPPVQPNVLDAIKARERGVRQNIRPSA